MFKEFSSTLARGIFLVFAAIVLAFGIIREYDLMTFIAPNNLPLQVLTMIIFTGGMLAWTFTFFSGSRGLVQHAVALISAIIGLAATIGATISDIWLREALVAQPENLGNMVVWLVTGAAGVTLLEVWVFHLSDPEVWAHIREGWAEHQLMGKVYAKTEQKVEAMSDALADELAEHRTDLVRAKIRSQVKGKREADAGQGGDAKTLLELGYTEQAISQMSPELARLLITQKVESARLDGHPKT